MHLSRLFALGPDVVRPGKLKLELVLTLGVALLENDLICCLVLLPCLDLRLIMPNKKICVVPVTLPTLICSPYPKECFAILQYAPLKSQCLSHRINVKKSI